MKYIVKTYIYDAVFQRGSLQACIFLATAILKLGLPDRRKVLCGNAKNPMGLSCVFSADAQGCGIAVKPEGYISRMVETDRVLLASFPV